LPISNLRKWFLRNLTSLTNRFSGAGILFGASGGVAEAALRMAVEKLTGKVLTDHLEFEEIRGFEGVKESTIDVNGTKVRVAVVSGLKNAEPIIEKILNGVDVDTTS